MGFYLDSQGRYYEGDKAIWTDVDVPQRPSAEHKWVAPEWVPDEDIIKTRLASEAKANLEKLDMKSIRPLREQTIATAIAVNKLKADATLPEVVAWLKATFALESWEEDGLVVSVNNIETEAIGERTKLG